MLIYIDDLINVGHTFDECCKNIDTCIKLSQNLGFKIHSTKSVHLRFCVFFCINSVNMTVKLTAEKKNSLHKACNEVLLHKTQSVWRVAQVIGMIVSGLSGVKYGGCYYRNLEREKISAITSNKGSFDANMTLSERACSDLQW